MQSSFLASSSPRHHIPRELAEHELKIFPNAKPIKQSTRRYNPEKARSMGEEINRLLEAKFIREIKEATWLSPRDEG
jgi:hypothetical protein